MPEMTRRKALGLLAVAPFAANAFTWTDAEAAVAFEKAGRAVKRERATGESFEPAFFTAAEFALVGVLADMVIPRDARSGGALDAGVPEFMDFMMTDKPDRQVAMRGGLAWIDAASRRMHGADFVAATPAQRASLLDQIAFPNDADEDMGPGTAFFNSFRDITASGFFTSKMGIEDLQYMGNRVTPVWNGCPDACYEHLGVTKPANG